MYTGDATACRKLPNCEVPLDTMARNVPCTCKSGFSMRSNGSCELSCLKTVYDPKNPSVCTSIDKCRVPPSGQGNCTCLAGLIQDRVGQCAYTCVNTTVPVGGSYSACTDKIGCRAPDYNTNKNTTNNSGKEQRCVCYRESFGPIDMSTGRCNCHNTTVGYDRGGNCACKPGTYVKSHDPLICQPCPANTFTDVNNQFTSCRNDVPKGGVMLSN